MICQVWKCRYGGGESDPKEVLGVDNTGDFEGSVSIVSDTIERKRKEHAGESGDGRGNENKKEPLKEVTKRMTCESW
ncbi:hypothetical protein JHK87_024565 [Glycine soja]|nr:hypothetical protein JHK87_024565 [Glycine soja]